ncbi:MAG: PorV/PorQ family protein [Bacteroidota bacterium]
MNKLIRFLSLLIIAGLIYIPAKAVDTQGTTAGQFLKVGAAGVQFLKIGVGARANGMAGAYGAVADDLTSIYWNPSGLAKVKGMGGDFSYTSWFAGFTHAFAAFSLPLGENYMAAVSLQAFTSDRIPITTMDKPQGTGSAYTLSDIAINATIAGYLTEQFSFGITAKMLNSSIAMLDAPGFAFDIGTMYETGIQGIRLGFSIHNLGTEMKYSGQDLQTTKKLVDALSASPLDVQYLASGFSLPLTFRAGIASDIINEDEHKLTAALDFVTLSDTPEQFAVGAEYVWNKIVAVRAGYRIGQDEFGLGGGFGVNYLTGGFNGQIDYSINPTKSIGLVNRISIQVRLK